ncbi:MAG: SEC-C metal-binding domain-containing protein [Luteolibacter sp.]
MHSRIREIINTSNYCHAAVMEAASLLPEDDAELDEWIGKVVEEHDIGGFTYLVLPAIHLGRKVASRHIEGGMQLIPDPATCGCILWNVDGVDVPERVLAGLERGGVNPETQAYAYLALWQWCRERRDGAVPPQFATSMRAFCRIKAVVPEAETLFRKVGHLLILVATNFKDEQMLASLGTSLAAARSETATAAALNLEKSFLAAAKGPILDVIPAQPAVILTRHTLRRSVERIGRNEDCPCGSGKKYKRCCFESDQQRLSQSSDVAGKTRAEVRESPGEFLTKARLEGLKSHELAKIDPLEIDGDLVPLYLAVLAAHKMFEEAVTALETLEWSDEIYSGWKTVLHFATLGERRDIVERLVRVREEADPALDELPPDTMLLLVRNDPAECLKRLEEIAMAALTTKDPLDLESAATTLMDSPVPALGLLVARGMVPVVPPKIALSLLGKIIAARDRLELSYDEPYSDIIDTILAAKSVAADNKYGPALRLANQKLEAKAGEVRKMKQSIDDLKHEIERREKLPIAPAEKNKEVVAVDEHALQDLRSKVKFLKGSLKERHEERAVLRHDLEKTLTDLETLRDQQVHPEPHPEPAGTVDPEDSLVLPGDVDGNQPMRLIEFPKKFRETLERFPKQVGKGAMVLLGRLAAGESAAFTGVVRLKACPDTLRARVGIDHRLLFRLQPDSVEVVDLINRKDLERRIKQL